MTDEILAFVGFIPEDDSFRAYLSLEGSENLKGDWEKKLEKSAEIYSDATVAMRKMKAQMDRMRKQRTPIPARRVWDLGDQVVRLTGKLRLKGLQIDGLYDHLCRDLAVKRMWLEKVIIFRSHIPRKALIPSKLAWARCRDAPKLSARRILEERN
ncbi:hypothetical protein J7J84_02995 [bacterium]|nr:hypothetical protein [bacterium]